MSRELGVGESQLHKWKKLKTESGSDLEKEEFQSSFCFRNNKIMRVFVATSEGQGLSLSDYCDLKEGDLVFFPLLNCRTHPDDFDCGCSDRIMDSNDPEGSTTTFKVADVDITKEEYYKKLVANDREKQLEELLAAASYFPVGTVLEKEEDDIRARSKWIWNRDDYDISLLFYP